MNIPTYTARYTDGAQEIIYERQPRGNLFGALPRGMNIDLTTGLDSTFRREDGGDAWENVPLVDATNGRRARITRDKQESKLEIAVAVDWVNETLRVFSNAPGLDVPVLVVSSPDPESTDQAEAQILADRLHTVAEVYG